MSKPLACYIGGKGMFASDRTWSFKTCIFDHLRQTDLGYDTRHQYYRPRFAHMTDSEFDRMVCDPIEYYDSDWQPGQFEAAERERALVEFWLTRDLSFQRQAEVGIFGLNEPGFGTAINISRFLQRNKPVYAFCHPDTTDSGTHNIHNIMQLELEYPRRFRLFYYDSQQTLCQQVTQILMAHQ